MNTDIGPDSEAQIAGHNDDYDAKDYHEHEIEHPEKADITAKSEKPQQQQQQQQHNGQQNGEKKTNTPV